MRMQLTRDQSDTDYVILWSMLPERYGKSFKRPDGGYNLAIPLDLYRGPSIEPGERIEVDVTLRAVAK